MSSEWANFFKNRSEHWSFGCTGVATTHPGPIAGCRLPLVFAAAIAVHLTRENGHRGPN